MGVSSSWDGGLSSSEFYLSAIAFSDRWKTSSHDFPPWNWVPSPRSLGVASSEVEGYLSLEQFSIDRNCEEDCNDGSYCEKEDLIDKSALVQNFESEINFYDFHIVYSNSYRVPVLYFRGYCSDGQPLTLANIENDLPSNSLKILRESKWTFITQEEHPILNRPWCTLHPCGTSEWMKLLFLAGSSSAKHDDTRIEQEYLVSWLSVIGQVVGLRVPLEILSSVANI